ncbi:MAG: isocitrate lyase/phosphoenolpyruvate mutase family protein, partial [Acetobacteraceae bacterium]|nr:isocitrate lyase/phosphoenolpyruvate mutase family protein [Acetobacteraceae bacterium]
ARTEALISGHPLEEALRRAEAYHAAGADAILVHSKKKDASEILAFMRRWDGRCPVVIVPTMYYATPTATFRDAGVSTVIWANHLVRASIAAMRDAAQTIAGTESLLDVEGRVTSVRDIFHLTGNDELEEASRRYLPATRYVRGIILAASRGAGLADVTADQPKCMVDVRGKPLLHRLLHTLDEGGVADVAVVAGYRREKIVADGITLLDNAAYAETSEAASLACATSRLRGETVVVYGDVLFRRYILEALLESQSDITIVVDSTRRQAADARDLVAADRHDSGGYYDDAPARLTGIAAGAASCCGEWIGLMHLSARGADLVREELRAMEADGSLGGADLMQMLERLARHHPVAVHYIRGHWLDVDTPTDLAEARNFS